MALEMPNTTQSPLEDTLEPPCKRMRTGEHTSAPVKRHGKRRYRPTERMTPAQSVLAPLSGFDYLELQLGQQNTLRKGPARLLPDLGGPSSFGRRLLDAAGMEMPAEEEDEAQSKADERTTAKVLKNLVRLSSASHLANFTTAMLLPMQGNEAAFYQMATCLADYNGEVEAFSQVARSKIRERRRHTREASINATGAADRASSDSNSRPSSASTHSTAITLPLSPPSRPAAFSSMVDTLRAEGGDHRGLSKDYLKQRMLKRSCQFVWSDIDFDEYLRRACAAAVVQLEAGCVRLVSDHQ